MFICFIKCHPFLCYELRYYVQFRFSSTTLHQNLSEYFMLIYFSLQSFSRYNINAFGLKILTTPSNLLVENMLHIQLTVAKIKQFNKNFIFLFRAAIIVNRGGRKYIDFMVHCSSFAGKTNFPSNCLSLLKWL